MKHVPTGVARNAMLLAAPTLNARGRGIYGGVRADASQGEKILAELQKTFETFKAERVAELDGIKKKFDDVVQKEKVDRINDEITKLQKALDETNALLAAVRVGGGEDGKGLTDDEKAHKKGFAAYFRKGAETGLRDLEVKAAATTGNAP
jgi:HK97 family phage major capsid protein